MTSARASFIGVDIDLLTMGETVERVRAAIVGRARLHHVAMNVAKFVTLRHNRELRSDVACSDLVGVDGMGVLFAARLLGIRVPERVAGVDLMESVIRLCADEGYRPYFLGATEQVLGAALANIRHLYPSISIAGAQHGYYCASEEPSVVAAIRDAGADCLFIALPTPRKERFLAAYRDALGVPFIMGVGGSIDIVARHTRRAPTWVQSIGCEWLYRTLQEPRRLWKRYLTTNVAFAGIVLRALLRAHVSTRT